MTSNSTANEDEERQKLMFDESLNQAFRETCHQQFLDVPELRSVIVTYDYYRNLNDMPNISKGLWLSAEGKDKPADAVAGSLGAVLQTSAEILDQLFQQYQTVQLQLTELSKAVREKQRELAELEEKVKQHPPTGDA